MRRKILAFIFACLICLSVIYSAPFTVKAATYSGSCGENVSWEVDYYHTATSDGMGNVTITSQTAILRITGSGDMQDYTKDSPAPWKTYASYITALRISEGITSIGDYAFAYLTVITDVKIPDGVTEIGAYAFSDCKKLTCVTIPESIKVFDKDVFYNCLGLIDTYYEGTIESWCAPTSGTVKFNTVASNPLYYSRYFYVNGELVTDLVIPEGVPTITAAAFCGNVKIESVIIPNSVISMGSHVFYKNRQLKKVELSERIKSIPKYTFYGCDFLEKLTMPISAKIADDSSTFYDCVRIKKITLTKGNGTAQNYDDFNYPYPSGEEPTNYQYTPWHKTEAPLEIVVEEGVTDIGIAAFYDSDYLEKVTLPKSLKNIGWSAFKYCKNLTHVYYEGNLADWCNNISFESNYSNPIYYTENFYANDTLITGDIEVPDGAVQVPFSAFYGYEKIQSVKIPDSVKSIKKFAFNGCTDLSDIVIGNGVKTIGEKAFYGCDILYTIHYIDTEESWNNITIASGNENLIDAPIKHFCPSESVIPTATTAGYRNKAVCKECNIVIIEGDDLPATGFEPTNGMAIDFDNNIIYGLASGITSLDDYTTLVNENYHWEYDSATLGTGTKAIMTDGEKTIAEYTVLIYGDVNGDGWYDGEDAFIVNLMTNGMLTEKNVGSLVWTAADCNHDGLIDENDIDLLVNAGLLLNEAKQNSEQPELALNTEYIQYTLLIEQNAETSFATDTIIETNTEEIKSDSIFEIIFTNLWNFIDWLIRTILSALV